MKNYDFYSGLFLMALSIGTCIMAYIDLDLGNIHNPGAGPHSIWNGCPSGFDVHRLMSSEAYLEQ